MGQAQGFCLCLTVNRSTVDLAGQFKIKFHVTDPTVVPHQKLKAKCPHGTYSSQELG